MSQSINTWVNITNCIVMCTCSERENQFFFSNGMTLSNDLEENITKLQWLILKGRNSGRIMLCGIKQRELNFYCEMLTYVICLKEISKAKPKNEPYPWALRKKRPVKEEDMERILSRGMFKQLTLKHRKINF